MIKKIFITAGGTGGHIFPAQSVGNLLAQDKNCEVTLLTDDRGKALKGFDSNIKVIQLPLCRSRKGLIKKLIFFASLTLSCGIAFFILLRHRPKVVVGFGGFPSLPGLLSAVVLKGIIGCKTIIHEQNAYLGKVNRKLQKFLDKIIISFPKVEQLTENRKSKFIGPLVRHGFTDIGKKNYTAPTKAGPINILVTGGSQGAYIFSACVPGACQLMPKEITKRIHITHQCRPQDVEETIKAYDNLGIKNNVVPFINDMQKEMEKAHFLICRAGASTISETIQAHRPAILVPYPYATDDHQRYNAKILVDNKAGWMILNKELTAENLSKTVKDLVLSDKVLEDAEKNLKVLSMDNAAQKFAEIIKNI